jgi:hypothetical protein
MAIRPDVCSQAHSKSDASRQATPRKAIVIEPQGRQDSARSRLTDVRAETVRFQQAAEAVHPESRYRLFTQSGRNSLHPTISISSVETTVKSHPYR